MSNLCPKCWKDDQVQKVSAIVTSGTYITTYQVPAQGQIAGRTIYGTVQQTGTGQSELAQILGMPDEKDWKQWREKQPSGLEIRKEYDRLHPSPIKESKVQMGCTILGLLGIVLGIVVIGLLQEPTMGCGLMLLFPLSLGVSWSLYQIFTSKEKKQAWKAWKDERKEYLKSQESDLVGRLEGIQTRATSRFDKLYYCYRDDVIFLPGTNYCVSSKEMSNMNAWVNLGEII
jgi:hypothetical protein